MKAGIAAVPGIQAFYLVAEGVGETAPQGFGEAPVLSFDEKGNLVAVNGEPAGDIPENLPPEAYGYQ